MTVALVAGGVPLTVVGVCAVEPMYGVIVYSSASRRSRRASTTSDADPVPAVAVTSVTCPEHRGVGCEDDVDRSSWWR